MLRNKKVLITSGPTRAPLDAMRFISNRSTGKFGVLLATEALRNGAKVMFVCGKGSLTPKSHSRLKCIEVETNEDVESVLKSQLKKVQVDVLIHAMAVLDFHAACVSRKKTSTKKKSWSIKLVPTPKIISQIKRWSPKTFLVGFKLEVGVTQKELLARARSLLKTARCDLVLANQLTEGTDTEHHGFLLDAHGHVVAEARGKEKLAKLIMQLSLRGPKGP